MILDFIQMDEECVVLERGVLSNLLYYSYSTANLAYFGAESGYSQLRNLVEWCSSISKFMLKIHALGE